MRAISLWQPWATLMALGLKQIETRAWRPPVEFLSGPDQGWVAIHSTVSVPRSELRAAWDNPAIRDVLAVFGITEGNWTSRPGSLPQRRIVAVVRFVSFQPTDVVGPALLNRGQHGEYQRGNYAPGRWAWISDQVINLNYLPVGPIRGRQGLFTLDPMDVEQVKAAVLLQLPGSMERKRVPKHLLPAGIA